jgi:large subunit ribosomal protein L6
MSRIGRLPVVIPKGVDIRVDGTTVYVKGPKGEMAHTFHPSMSVAINDDQLEVTRATDNRFDRSLHGMTRALINNMVVGVSAGFERILEVNGVGYRAEMQGQNLVLYVGYSHPVVVEPPKGISFETDAKTRQIRIRGYDKQQIGQLAADIRKVRPPEPYQGKGIKYLEEKIRRKAGKAGKV